jgi:hypothetical protein
MATVRIPLAGGTLDIGRGKEQSRVTPQNSSEAHLISL